MLFRYVFVIGHFQKERSIFKYKDIYPIISSKDLSKIKFCSFAYFIFDRRLCCSFNISNWNFKESFLFFVSQGSFIFSFLYFLIILEAHSDTHVVFSFCLILLNNVVFPEHEHPVKIIQFFINNPLHIIII